MKKNITLFFAILMMAVISVSLTACGDDDDISKGWYTDVSAIATASDFEEINKAIENNEVLSTYGKTKYVASYDLFFYDDGLYKDGNAYFGRLRFSIPSCINVIHIVDDHNLIMYSAYLRKENTVPSNEDVVARIYAGRIFGNLVYSGQPRRRTYAKEGEIIVTTDGDIISIVEGGFYVDGFSGFWSKYDPNKRY